MISSEELLTRVNNPDNFPGRNGMRVTEIGDGTARGEMADTSAIKNLLGGIHGGALYTLADAVTAMAICSGGQAYVTLGGSMEYLRPACPGVVTCEAKVRKTGKTIAVGECTLTDSAGTEIAIGTFTFYATNIEYPK